MHPFHGIITKNLRLGKSFVKQNKEKTVRSRSF